MIHAVIFDFGNVICTFDLQQFLMRISPFSKKSLSELQGILPSFRDVAIEYETGLITSDHFFEEIRKRSELSISKQEFIKAYCKIFVPIPTTFDLVRRLKKSYKLGLVSNTSEWHYQYGIRPVAIFPLFDAVTLSFEVKAMKPARAMYDDILAKLAVDPPECVFVDDIKENVDAAIDLGMYGIHYISPEVLLGSLHDLNVVI
jgi:HAD superfamily hydrolase (TIGR01509 family)